MKRYLYILLLLPLIPAVSCNWDNLDKLYPEEYYKVLYLKDPGSRDVVMNTAQDAVIEQMFVVKAGAHPEMWPSVPHCRISSVCLIPALSR